MSNPFFLDYELKELYERLESQQSRGDELQKLTLSNIRYLEGQNAYLSGHYHLATRKLKESIAALIENFKVVRSFDSETAKSEIIRKAKSYYTDRARYLIAATILDENLGRNYETVTALRKSLLGSPFLSMEGFKVGNRARTLAVEEGIALVLIHNPEKLPDISNEDSLFDATKFTELSKERRLSIHKAYYINKLNNIEKSVDASTPQTSRERARCHLAMSKILLEEEGTKHSNYFEHYTDYLKYDCLTAKELKTFWSKYELLEKSLDDYARYTHRQDLINRKSHLELAFVLIHALRITTTLIDKVEISRLITIHYTYAGSYNRERFRVYWDWYKTAHLLLNAKTVNKKSLEQIQIKVNRIRSLYFVDRDDDYLSKHLPEIKNTQQHLHNVRDFINSLAGKDEYGSSVNRKALKAALILFQEKLMDLDSTFKILQKYLETELKISSSPEPLRLIGHAEEPVIKSIYLDLIEQGESHKVEFKETWRYDLRTSKVNKDIQDNTIKDIASFMNTEGGIVFIGISDDGVIKGLSATEGRLYKNNIRDELKKHIDNSLSSSLGASRLTLTKIHFEKINNDFLVVINVRPSSSPVWVDNDKLFIRRSASSIEITGSEMFQYCQERFLAR